MSSIDRNLSDRELSVVELAAQGRVDKEIARELKIQPKTVRTYWERLRQKLIAKTRTHAVTCAIAMGMIDAESACLKGRKDSSAAKGKANG
jgi:DNA-binding NarL/FixJ family response regulator